MSRIKTVLLILIFEVIVLKLVQGQSTILTWPLTANYTNLVYNTSDLDNAGYTAGSGIIEPGLAADGGAWYNFTENDYLDENDYVQISLSAATGGSPQNVYITSLEFNLKQTPWFIYDGPTKYELYYSKNSDFSDSTLLSSGNITTSYTSEDVSFASPLSIFTGETLYFRLFAFLSGGWGDLVIEENQFIVKGYTENSPSINPIPSVSFVQDCDVDGNLIFDLPSGFNSSNETLLIFAKANSAITTGPSTALLSAYPNADNDLSTFSGSSYEHDANAKLVYRGTSSGPQYLSGMTAGVDYYFIAFNFLNNGGSGNISGATFGEGSVTGIIPEVNTFNGVGSNTIVSLSFEAPTCVDAIMIVAKEGSITQNPSGDGTSYTADSDYLGSGSNFDGGKVVYNNTHAPLSNGNVVVTSLNNNTDYHFKAFVRKGTNWSSGYEIIATPNMAAIAFTQSQANGSDFFEFITLERQDLSSYNITDQGVCEDGAIYRSFSEWEEEDFFNSTGNSDITNPLVDVPAGTFVKVYSGNTTVDDGFEDGLITLRNSNLNLDGANGDQVMVYTGSIPGPFADCSVSANPIKAGINFADVNDWITTGTPDDNTSYKPNTSGAFATLNSRGRSRYQNSNNIVGDSANVLTGLLTTSNWQHKNNNGDYWKLKKILFNQSDYQSGDLAFSNVSSNSIDLDASALLFDQATRSTRYMVVIRDNAAPQNPVDRYSCYSVTNDINTTDDVVRNVTINYNNGNPCGTSQTQGNGKVVYFDYDLPNSLTIDGLAGCTTYQVSIYAVNGNGVTSNFGSSVTDQVTTSSSGPPASVYYSQQSGNFSAAIWDDVVSGTSNSLPTLTPCLKLVIQAGHTVTLDIDVSFGELEIENNGTFELGSQVVSLQRDFTITGSLNANTGKVIMNGSDGQQIIQTSTESVFYDLEMNKASSSEINDLLIDGDIAISHLMTIINGDLTIQGGNSLRLISDKADYAAALGIVPSSSTITGEFIIERFFPGIITNANAGAGVFGTGWRYVSSPIQNGDFTEINDDFFTGGLIGSDYPNWLVNDHYYPSVKKYNESVPGDSEMGFDSDPYETVGGVNVALIAPNIRYRRNINSAADNTLGNGEGVLAYVSSIEYPSLDTATLDWQGEVYYGDLTYNLSYTNNGSSTDDGWNLVGNPYPCAIDWRNVTRGAGVSNFIYIYNTEGAGNYVILDALSSSEQLVASSNAFWVQTNQNSSIAFEESDKSLDVTAPFYKNGEEEYNDLYIHIYRDGDSSLSDFTRLRFMDQATNNYDVEYDALKKYSFNTNVPGLSTMIDTNDFAINSFSKNDTIINIPLKAKIGQNGDYTFSFDMAGSYFDESCLILHDIQEDTYSTVSNNESYQFASLVNEVTDSNRFELILSPTTKIITDPATCYGAENGGISAETYGIGPFTYSIYDANNQLITSIESNEEFVYNELPYGIYTLEVSGLIGNCETIQQEFFIEQPEPSDQHSSISYNSNCQGTNDGEIEVLLSDSLNYTLSLFSNGELIRVKESLIDENYFSNLYEGEYELEIANECLSQTIEVEILSNDSMLLNFELSSETIYLQDGGEVQCINQSVNTDAYNWFFFDGQDYEYTEEDAEYVYTEAGTYDIYLFGKTQAGCNRYISKTVEVIDLANSQSELDDLNGYTEIRYSNESVDLYFKNIDAKELKLTLLNELGQQIYSTTVNPATEIYNLDNRSLKAGVYLIKIESTGDYSEVKRFVLK